MIPIHVADIRQRKSIIHAGFSCAFVVAFPMSLFFFVFVESIISMNFMYREAGVSPVVCCLCLRSEHVSGSYRSDESEERFSKYF
jgi:hypothetical protein